MLEILRTNKLFIILIILIFAYFLTQTIFYGANLALNRVPDERHHHELSMLYKNKNGLGPLEDSEITYKFGNVSTAPYLYNWIMGKSTLLNFNTFGITNLVFLRLINIAIATLTLIVLFIFSRDITGSKWKGLFVILMFVLTPMFPFLSSGVNYDNLVILISALSFLFFWRWYRKQDIAYLIILLTLLAFGNLVKISFAPLALLLGVAALMIGLYNRKKLIFIDNKEFTLFRIVRLKKNYLRIVLLVPFLLFTLLNIQLFGSNLLNYSSVYPDCDVVLTQDQCLENGIYLRNLILSENEENLAKPKVDPASYLLYWGNKMLRSTLGILGGKLLEYNYINIFIFLFFISVTIYKLVEDKLKSRKSLFLLFAIIFYSLFILYENFKTYSAFNLIDLTVQGRYLFPIFYLIYILIAINFFKKKNNFIIAFSVMLIVIFILFGFPYMIANFSPLIFIQ